MRYPLCTFNTLRRRHHIKVSNHLSTKANQYPPSSVRATINSFYTMVLTTTI
jgi:hypothetical protein